MAEGEHLNFFPSEEKFRKSVLLILGSKNELQSNLQATENVAQFLGMGLLGSLQTARKSIFFNLT